MTDKDLPEGVHTKFDQSMSYTDYLSLSTLLNAQKPTFDLMVLTLISHSSRPASSGLSGVYRNARNTALPGSLLEGNIASKSGLM